MRDASFSYNKNSRHLNNRVQRPWVVHLKPNITILPIEVEGHTKNIIPVMFYGTGQKCLVEEVLSIT